MYVAGLEAYTWPSHIISRNEESGLGRSCIGKHGSDTVGGRRKMCVVRE